PRRRRLRGPEGGRSACGVVPEPERGRDRPLGRLEPGELDQAFTRTRVAARARRPGQAEYDAAVVRLEPVPEELLGLDLERCLFADLAPQCVERKLVLVQEAAR